MNFTITPQDSWTTHLACNHMQANDISGIIFFWHLTFSKCMRFVLPTSWRQGSYLLMGGMVHMLHLIFIQKKWVHRSGFLKITSKWIFRVKNWSLVFCVLYFLLPSCKSKYLNKFSRKFLIGILVGSTFLARQSYQFSSLGINLSLNSETGLWTWRCSLGLFHTWNTWSLVWHSMFRRTFLFSFWFVRLPFLAFLSFLFQTLDN